MKAILMSIRPQHVANILNGLKTLEIRKKFPKDYVGWVYIYVTKDKQLTLRNERYILINGEKYHIDSPVLNGKVVARFWCDKVEEIKSCQVPFTFEQTIRDFYTDTFNDMDDLLKASCLDYYSLEQYLKYSKLGYAIHITNLEIFDKPKELSDFEIRTLTRPRNINPCVFANGYFVKVLTRAPQSYCFIEV